MKTVFFKDVLNLQIGIDGRFVNAYQPYSRYAAFNILYSGTEEKLPYSLILDVFINANVKRIEFLSEVRKCELWLSAGL